MQKNCSKKWFEERDLTLYGVFDISTEPSELPLLDFPHDLQAYKSFKSILDSKQSEINSYLEKRSKELIQKSFIEKYLLTASEGMNLSKDELKKLASSKSLLHEPTIRWRDYLKAKKKSEDPIYAAWFKLSSLKADSFIQSFQLSLKDLEKNESKANNIILSLLKKKLPVSGKLFTEHHFSNSQQHSQNSSSEKPGCFHSNLSSNTDNDNTF